MVSELDQLLEQQTQMDIRMSAFQHMLYGEVLCLMFNTLYIMCTYTSLITQKYDGTLHYNTIDCGYLSWAAYTNTMVGKGIVGNPREISLSSEL